MSNGNAARKKAIERSVLDHFVRVSGIAAAVIDDDGEAPDLLIRVDNALVGVEVTELFQDSVDEGNTQQAQENIARRIAEHAQQMYRERHAPHAHVSVHFSPSADLRRLNRQQTAKALAEFVASQSLEPWVRRDWRQDYESGTLPDCISYLNMLGVPEAGMAHWSTPQAGWVAPLLLDKIQQRINEKAALLPKYRERVSTNWLLLASDGACPSQFFELPEQEVLDGVSSPFDRTFYVARFKGVVVELGRAR